MAKIICRSLPCVMNANHNFGFIVTFNRVLGSIDRDVGPQLLARRIARQVNCCLCDISGFFSSHCGAFRCLDVPALEYKANEAAHHKRSGKGSNPKVTL